MSEEHRAWKKGQSRAGSAAISVHVRKTATRMMAQSSAQPPPARICETPRDVLTEGTQAHTLYTYCKTDTDAHEVRPITILEGYDFWSLASVVM